jgi:eukaryotic-like serine/threonine-protein kinase
VLALSAGATVAIWQARRAERRFADVRHLANVFLFDFEQSIHNVPGATNARQLLVKTALEYLRSLSREAAGDPVLTRELAAAYEKVGDIQGDPGAGNVGDTAGAVRSYQEAISLRRGVTDADSADPKLGVGMVQALWKLASVQARTRDLDGAFRNCQQAVSLAEALVKAHPGESSVTEALAQSYSEMAFRLLSRNDVRASLDYARRGLALRESLASAAPHDHAAQSALARAYWKLGSVIGQMDTRSAETLACHRKALAIYEKLSAQDPADAAVKRHLMIEYAELGRTQFLIDPKSKQSRLDGIANMRRAYAIAERAVTADPANTEAVSDLVAVSVRLGTSLATSSQRAEGARVLERAVRAAAELVQRDPESGENRLNLGIAHSHLANYLGGQGDTDGAIHHRQVAANIYKDLVAATPHDTKVLLSQVWNWQKLGDLLVKRGDWAKARSTYALGRTVAEKLAPGNPAFADVLAEIQRADLHAAQVLKNRR